MVSFESALLKAFYFAGITLVSLVIADILIVFYDKFLRPLTLQTKTKLDDYVFEEVRGPFKFLAFLVGLYFAFQYSAPNFVLFDKNIDQLFFLSLILAAGHTASKIADAVFYWHSTENASQTRMRLGKDAFPLARKMVKVSIYIAALLIVLSEFGVEIGPLLAGLGIAGLAVALALQSTLANFFAGLYLVSEKPARMGDRVSIDSENGLTGNIEQITWRTTHIRSPGNVLYIIPNEKFANSIIVNYDLAREKAWPVVLKFSVPHDANLELVKTALLEVDAELKKMDANVVPEFEPVIRVDSFNEAAITMVYIFQTKTYTDRYLALHEANLLLVDKLKKYDVKQPFSSRTVVFQEDRKVPQPKAVKKKAGRK